MAYPHISVFKYSVSALMYMIDFVILKWRSERVNWRAISIAPITLKLKVSHFFSSFGILYFFLLMMRRDMFNRLTAYMLLCMLLYTCIWQLITLCIIFCEWRGSINVSSNCSNWKFAFYNIFIIFVPICGIRVEAKNNRAFSDLNVILPYFIGRN